MTNTDSTRSAEHVEAKLIDYVVDKVNAEFDNDSLHDLAHRYAIQQASDEEKRIANALGCEVGSEKYYQLVESLRYTESIKAAQKIWNDAEQGEVDAEEHPSIYEEITQSDFVKAQPNPNIAFIQGLQQSGGWAAVAEWAAGLTEQDVTQPRHEVVDFVRAKPEAETTLYDIVSGYRDYLAKLRDSLLNADK